ncbi:hypothetical protein [Crocosphaera watsonii]|nr:hypothetical protein [Crocosphaera watsonii]
MIFLTGILWDNTRMDIDTANGGTSQTYSSKNLTITETTQLKLTPFTLEINHPRRSSRSVNYEE